MTYRVLPLLLVALALIAFVGTPALAEDKNNETHEGKIVHPALTGGGAA